MKDETSKKKRIYITLNTSNKEDREVYNILRKKSNINYYVRQAVLYFNKGARLDPRTVEDIREVVAETIREMMAGKAEGKISEKMPGKKTDLPEKPEQTEEIKDEDELDLTGIEDLF